MGGKYTPLETILEEDEDIIEYCPETTVEIVTNIIDAIEYCLKINITMEDITTDITEEILHVVMVVSNPCNFKRRWQLALEFADRLKGIPNLILYRVEVVYPGQDFHITSSDNPRHLQIRTESPIWHKESMVNTGIKNLLPNNWTKVAWIDADLEFDSQHWVNDTLYQLDRYDIVQCFSQCLDLAKDGSPMNIWNGAAYQMCHKVPRGTGINYWHPGYAWACTRKAYDQMGGLFDLGILGSGDDHMFKAWMGNSESVHGKAHQGYKDALKSYTERSQGFKIGYVPCIIRHNFHGSKANRKYLERWDLIVKYGYNPEIHVTYNEIGLLVVTSAIPKAFLDDIMKYFLERNDDE